ncbi:ExbD/TolR family protein [Glaciimonas soli]|uniref:Biopolymer transporter ExbD n=1 Tax=Glaciimonas soli TaxID=2590999 RepID=A0A843YSP2_9BURK|nr:biopolymer transporter ExbD [Glaciimonas soli]MQR02170.1 biopolymer transporter ExbD [Glaciimonas soli]
MAFGGFDDTKQNAPMADINITPMVDVMLVLLVIFIITSPLFVHAIKVDLPTAQAAQASEKPETIVLSINHDGKFFWDNDAVEEGELTVRLAAASKKQPQPELQLRADKDTRYETLAQIMSLAQTNGLTKIGFVTEPKATNAAPITK